MKEQPRNKQRRFRPTSKLGELVLSDPRLARARLVGLFDRLETRSAVAKDLGVPDSTVARWIKRLVEAGLADPRTSARGARQPRRSNMAALLAKDPAALRDKLKERLRARRGESRTQTLHRVAESFGVNEITIRRAAERVGLHKGGVWLF